MPDAPAAARAAAVLAFEEIDSTNSEAARLAAKGEAGPLWIRADMQTSGRGRSGRSFASPRGNLYATLLFVPGCEAATVHQLSLVTGVAVHDAIISAAGPIAGLRLKWPNDVLVGSAKMVGILPESIAGMGDRETLAMVGIGINLVSHPEHLGREATHLAAHGSAPDVTAMLDAVDTAMARWLAVWDRSNGFASVRAAWLERAGPKGEMLAINAGEGRVEGRFAGLDADGSLLLEDPNGGIRRFLFGDVTVVPDRTGV
jgi:BirA family biotin operon repressor/biotin-[acetyl-CoA-carboxylase] ligase